MFSRALARLVARVRCASHGVGRPFGYGLVTAAAVMGLVAVCALTAVAAEQAVDGGEGLSSASAGKREPLPVHRAKAPLKEGRGVDVLVENARKDEARARAFKEKVASPEWRAAREKSETEFVGMSDSEAGLLVEGQFGRELAGPMAAFGFEAVADGRPVREFVNDHTVVLASKGDLPPVLFESPWPLRAVDDDGHKRPVDLSLERRDGGFLPVNAVSDLRLPEMLGDGIGVGPVQVVPAGAAQGVLSGDGGSRVIYPNAQTDTDVVVTPIETGVEVFWQLRSSRAAEELTLDLRLPEGAVVQEGKDGSAMVMRDGEQLTMVRPPVAVDAQDTDIPVEMAVSGHQLVLSIAHRDSDIAYPVLVDPIIESYWEPNGGTWFRQNTAALNRLFEWDVEGEDQAYYVTEQCEEAISCDAAIGWAPYDYWKADGLHIYAEEAPYVYPAGHYAQWLYYPPGTTTRIQEGGFYSFYHRRGGSQNPWMFTGIYSYALGNWAPGQITTHTQDHANATLQYFAANQPGPQSLVFGFYTPTAVSNGNVRDGYIGASILALTDPEVPATNISALMRKETAEAPGAVASWVPRNTARWVSTTDSLALRYTVNDPGLGLKRVDVTGTGVSDTFEWPCIGNWVEPCPPTLEVLDSDQFEFSPSAMPDGNNSINIAATDALGQTSNTPVTLKVDSKAPTVKNVGGVESISGSLWSGREVTPTPQGGQPVLAAGNHALNVTMEDLAPPGSPAGLVRSGVEKVEIKVDGETEAATTVVQCSGGNCERSLSWTYNTLEFAGRHQIQVFGTDGAGNKGVRSFWVNAPKPGELVLPEDGEKTSSRVALQAKANQDGFTGVVFQYRRTPFGAWTPVGTSGLTQDDGLQASAGPYPLDQPNRHTKKLIWDVRSAMALLVSPPEQIQVRAVFNGPGSFKSQVANVRIDAKGLSAGNAQQAIGPGSVDLLTGNFSYTATDASLSSFAGPISVARTFNSSDPDANPAGPFGPGWVSSAPVDGVSEYSSLEELTAPAVLGWVDVFDSSAKRIRFEKLADGSYKAEPGFEELTLRKVAGDYTLTDLDGTVTTFAALQGAAKRVPTKVEEANSQTPAASYHYEIYQGEPRLKRIIAPGPAGLDCTQGAPAGCRVLEFAYVQIAGVSGTRLQSIKESSGGASPVTVAEFTYFTAGDAIGRLATARDPRLGVYGGIEESYVYYTTSRRLWEIKPSGVKPWHIGLRQTVAGDPHSVKLDWVEQVGAVTGAAKWRMSWGVPLSGAGAPYDMSAGSVSAWGQTDRPTDATAIIPPDEAGTSLAKASIYYVNQDGRVVNTAARTGGITTSEYDAKGNVVRELTASNRAKALAAGGGSLTTATEAGFRSTYSTYSADGLELREELGPRHQVKLDSGQVGDARAHTVTTYDENSSLPADKAAHLPTTVRTGAQLDPSQPDVDVRTTKTEYDWAVRKPTKTIVDAETGGLNITSQTTYNAAGLPIESRMPKSNGLDGGTTQTLYYTADTSSPDPVCDSKPEWFNLPCKVKPAASTAAVPVETFTYNRYQDVLTATEQFSTGSQRVTTVTYDAAGRRASESLTTNGARAAIPGLVAAYGFEEPGGTNVVDTSGKNNHGTITQPGPTRTDAGKYGSGLMFDGTNDSVAVPDAASLDLTTGMTLSAWVKPVGVFGAWQEVIFKERSSDGVYRLDADQGGFARQGMGFSRADGWQAINGPTASTFFGPAMHLAGTWDGQTLKLYVNGTLVQSSPSTGPILTSTGALRIGGTGVFGDDRYFAGMIDEVRVYNQALTELQVQSDRDTSVSTQTPHGSGEPVPTTTNTYDNHKGNLRTVSTPTGTTVRDVDDLGRPVSYKDTDETWSSTTYDTLNRPVTTNDGKGTQTRTYDATTGLLTSLADSHAGTFGATYDVDGRVSSKIYPNGMKADIVYDAVGSPVRLTYTKTSNCSSSCTWVDEQVTESIHGQWRTHDWDLSSQEYVYDKAGRLTRVQDDVHSPAAVSGCTIRAYAFDRNSNRTSRTTRLPAADGACAPSAAPTTTTYAHDTGDRLSAQGVVYDSFSRIKSLPAHYSGGGTLTYTHYANDQVRTVEQDGVSKTYKIDALDRHHKTVTAGGNNHTETLHYQDDSDSSSWSRITNGTGQEVSWDRNVEGIDGDLAAVRTHTATGDATVLQLSNLHGDIIATASTDTNATQPTAKFETDEFGNPRQPSTRRHGWLGGKERRTELASGVIQMGVRSYVPHMGRFTSVDPVAGGSANSYDYANADPINNLDLDGRQARWRNPWAMISPYLNKGVEKAGKAYVETVHAAWDCSKSATMNYFRTLDFRKAAFSCVVGGVRGVVRRSPWWARMKRKITEYGSRKFVCQWNNKTPRCRRAVRGDFGRSGKT